MFWCDVRHQAIEPEPVTISQPETLFSNTPDFIGTTQQVDAPLLELRKESGTRSLLPQDGQITEVGMVAPPEADFRPPHRWLGIKERNWLDNRLSYDNSRSQLRQCSIPLPPPRL